MQTVYIIEIKQKNIIYEIRNGAGCLPMKRQVNSESMLVLQYNKK